jgi:hypothetical protein
MMSLHVLATLPAVQSKQIKLLLLLAQHTVPEMVCTQCSATIALIDAVINRCVEGKHMGAVHLHAGAAQPGLLCSFCN